MEDTDNKTRLLPRMRRAALAAGIHIRTSIHSRSTLNWQRKDDGSLISDTDLQAQEIIQSELSDLDCPIISEEDDTSHKLIPQLKSLQAFLVDPLDGTSAFKRYIPNTFGETGFGPIVGYSESGKCHMTVFVHLPFNKMYTAILNDGLFCEDIESVNNPEEISALPEPDSRLPKVGLVNPTHSAMTFYVSNDSTILKFVGYLAKKNYFETFYRFGGFGNDCVRLALNYEQCSCQLVCKPWDYSASLLAYEAGYKIIFDPFGDSTPYSDWVVKAINPSLIFNPALEDLLNDAIDYVKNKC